MRLRQKLAEVRREGRAFEDGRAKAQATGVCGPMPMFHAANVPVPPTVAAHTEAILAREASARESAIRAQAREREASARYGAEVLIRAASDRSASGARGREVGAWIKAEYLSADRAGRGTISRALTGAARRGFAPVAYRLARAVQEGRDLAPKSGALPYVPPGQVAGAIPQLAVEQSNFPAPDARAEAALAAGAEARWRREIAALRWQRRMARRAGKVLIGK